MKRKSVGITTTNISFLMNYGASLQAAALCEQLRAWRYEPHIINYTYLTCKEDADVVKEFSIPRMDMRILLEIIKRGYVDHPLARAQHFLYRKQRRQMLERFVKFRSTFLPMHQPRMATYEELCQTPPRYDIFITGSDQVWNPYNHNSRNDPGHFLKFAPPGARRIAYAASFGVSEIPEDCMETLGPMLEGFDAISVREKSGAEIIRKATGLDVPVILDPTLMADPVLWDRIAQKPENLPDEYILCYRFSDAPAIHHAVRRISRREKLPVVELPLDMNSYAHNTKLRFDIGPSEFIGAIRRARLVLTDSFHASVFSILNHVPFCAFPRSNAGVSWSMNSRFVNLLEPYGLMGRMITQAGGIDYARLYDVDFSQADAIIPAQRAESQRFLRKALGEIE